MDMDDGSSFEEEAMESELDIDGDDEYSADDLIGEWTVNVLGNNGDGASFSREVDESEPDMTGEVSTDTEVVEDDAVSEASATLPEQPQDAPEPSPALTPDPPVAPAPEPTGDAGDYIIGRSSDAAREFDATLRSHTVDEFKDEDEDFLRQLAQQRLATREKIRRREEERLAREREVVPQEESSTEDDVVVDGETPLSDDNEHVADNEATSGDGESVDASENESSSHEEYEPDAGDEYEPPEGEEYESSQSDDASHGELSDEQNADDDGSRADESGANESSNDEFELSSSEATQPVVADEPAETESVQPEESVEQLVESVESSAESVEPVEQLVEQSVVTPQPVPTIIAPVPSASGEATHVIVSVADFEALSKRASINFGGLPPRISATTMDKKFGLAPDEKTQSVSIPSSLILFLSNLLQIGVLAFHGDSGLSDDEISILEKKYSKTAFARLSASRGDLFEAWVDYVVDRGTNPRLITAYTLATASNNIEGLTLDVAGIDDDTRRMITYFSAATKNDDQIEIMAVAMEDMRKSLLRIRNEQLELSRTAMILERGQSYLIAESTGKATSHVGASPDGLSVLSSDAQKVYERVRSHVERDIQRKKDTDGRRVPADQRGAKKGVRVT